MHRLDEYREIDAVDIAKYNRRRKSEKHRLHVDMGPAPFDGDPDAAKIILVMNNPMFIPNVSVPKHHTLAYEGYPLAGLCLEAPACFRDWYDRPLGDLMRRFGRQLVSQRVALVQRVPWASERFDSSCKLKSLEWQVEIVQQAVARGALVVIGRSISFWQSRLGNAPNIYKASSVANPTITYGNLKSLDGINISEDEFTARFLAWISTELNSPNTALFLAALRTHAQRTLVPPGDLHRRIQES